MRGQKSWYPTCCLSSILGEPSKKKIGKRALLGDLEPKQPKQPKPRGSRPMEPNICCSPLRWPYQTQKVRAKRRLMFKVPSPFKVEHIYFRQDNRSASAGDPLISFSCQPLIAKFLVADKKQQANNAGEKKQKQPTHTKNRDRVSQKKGSRKTGSSQEENSGSPPTPTWRFPNRSACLFVELCLLCVFQGNQKERHHR